MKLFEHVDFDQAILEAESHFKSQGLRAAIIENDYYVTEALRIIAATAGIARTSVKENAPQMAASVITVPSRFTHRGQIIRRPRQQQCFIVDASATK
jgi:hypothetical protein